MNSSKYYSFLSRIMVFQIQDVSVLNLVSSNSYFVKLLYIDFKVVNCKDIGLIEATSPWTEVHVSLLVYLII